MAGNRSERNPGYQLTRAVGGPRTARRIVLCRPVELQPTCWSTDKSGRLGGRLVCGFAPRYRAGDVVSRTRLRCICRSILEGYVEGLRETATVACELNYFNGGSRMMVRIESLLAPGAGFCRGTSVGGHGMRPRRRQQAGGSRQRWANDGEHRSHPNPGVGRSWCVAGWIALARELLAVDHPINAYSLSCEDVRGRIVEILMGDGRGGHDRHGQPGAGCGANVAICSVAGALRL